MIVISHVLGNVKTDPVWAEKLKAYELDYLTLEHGDMYKNSCRKMTEQGKDLGISLERTLCSQMVMSCCVMINMLMPLLSN